MDFENGLQMIIFMSKNGFFNENFRSFWLRFEENAENFVLGFFKENVQKSWL